MINFFPVFTTGLVVRCKTLEDSHSFIEEVEEVLGRNISGIELFDDDYLKRFHIRKGSEAAYRIYTDRDGDIRIRHGRFSWYREQSRYTNYTFIEYSQDFTFSCDDVFNEKIDISYLFGGE